MGYEADHRVREGWPVNHWHEVPFRPVVLSKVRVASRRKRRSGAEKARSALAR